MRNELAGMVAGHSVQARDIGRLTFNIAADRTPPVRPAMLRAAPVPFVNRRVELDMLAGELGRKGERARPVLVVLTGLQGVGKTATALHWLHQVSAEFPDGALYADLGGSFGVGAVDPGEVLVGFLRALGVSDEAIPSRLDDQAALFRSHTSTRSLVILLDDVVDAAQVRPLLPASRSSLVVVTSRRALSGLTAEGARIVRLGPLDVASAVDLLARCIPYDRRVRADPDSASSVARLCGSLPLALMVVVAQLAAHPRWELSRVASRLGDERRRLEGLVVDGDPVVRAALDTSYAELPGSVARAYRLLGLHPGREFGLDAVTALLAEARDDAAALLEALDDVDLVQEVGTERYRIHRLVHVHAREVAEREETPQARKDALFRLLDWYLRTAVSADRVLSGRRRVGPYFGHVAAGFDGDRGRALEWLDVERVNLLGAVHAAVASGFDQVAWQLCEALWGLYFQYKYIHDWIESHQAGLVAAARCGDRTAEFVVLHQLGSAHFDRLDYDQAAQCYQGALDAARQGGYLPGESSALESLGRVRLQTGDPGSALDLFDQALGIAEQVAARDGRMRPIALLHHHRGRALSMLGRHAEAVDELGHAHTAMVQLPDRYNEARVLTSLGEALLRAGRADAAAEPLHRALDIMGEQGSRFAQAGILRVLGEAAERSGDIRSSLVYLESARAMYQALVSPQARDVAEHIDTLRGSAGVTDQPDA